MSKIKTIAVVVNSAWNIINFRLGLIRKFIDLGYRVIAIAPEDHDPSEIKATGASFISVQYLDRKGINPIRDLQLIRELRAIFIQQEVDLIFNFTIKPVIYGSLASGKRKVINTITGLGYSFIRKGIINRIAKSLYFLAFKKADYIVFQNDDDKDELVNLKLVPREKAVIIPGSGINSEVFEYTAFPPRNDKLQVLFVGRMLIDKGIVELLDAFRRLDKDNFELHLVGGIDKDNPAAISEEQFDHYTSDSNIIYHGKVKRTKDYYQKAHIVVLPSYREGLPRSILEAMSTGRPILVTDVPGCRQTVEDQKNGFLVPVKDSDAILKALERINAMEHSALSKMGEEGRKMVENVFDEKLIVEKYAQMIRNLSSLK